MQQSVVKCYNHGASCLVTGFHQQFSFLILFGFRKQLKLVIQNYDSALCFYSRYVKSRSDKQLLYGLKYNGTSYCKPEDSNNGLPIVPCGLIAWSLFNDTYSFSRGTSALKVNRKNISWKSDRDHKFGKEVYPFNFQNGSLIGGGNLDPNIPVSIYSTLDGMFFPSDSIFKALCE